VFKIQEKIQLRFKENKALRN